MGILPNGAGESPHVLSDVGWLRARDSLRLPGFWLLIGLLVVGVGRLWGLLHPLVRAYPHATIAAVILFGLYAVPFVLVVRSLDFLEQEPAPLLLTAFAWGGVVATSTAAVGGSAAHDLLAKEFSPVFASQWGSALVAPTLEEPLKVLGVVVIVLIARYQVNSVVDGFVYGAFVGLGFQVIEDIIFALDQVARDGLGDQISPVIGQFLLRGFIGGLWSHTVFSALAGAGVGYLVVRREQPWSTRILVAALALVGAWTFHFIWNSPWLADGFGVGTVGVLGVVLLKGAPALVLVVVLARLAGRLEAHHYLEQLLLDGDPELCTARELAVLASGRQRWAARRYALDRCGKRGAREVKQLQLAQARVAVQLSRGGLEDAELHRQRAWDCRARLRSWGHPEAFAPVGGIPPWWYVFLVLLGCAGFAVLFSAVIIRLGGS